MKADSSRREFLEKLLGSKDVTEEQIHEIRRVVIETGALEACRETARGLVEESREALKGCGWREEGVAFLEGALGFMVEREY